MGRIAHEQSADNDGQFKLSYRLSCENSIAPSLPFVLQKRQVPRRFEHERHHSKRLLDDCRTPIGKPQFYGFSDCFHDTTVA